MLRLHIRRNGPHLRLPFSTLSTADGSTSLLLKDPLAPPIEHSHLASLPSLLGSGYTPAPPIRPWPHPLLPRRLALLLRRQSDLHLCVRIFLFAHHHSPGFRHNHLTFGVLLHKLSLARSFHLLESLLSLLASLPAVVCREDAFISVIRSYALALRPSSALRTFLSIRPRFRVNTSVRSLNALFNAMIHCRRPDLVPVLFRSSRSKFGIRPNVCSCNILIKSLCSTGDLHAALKVLDEMPVWGIVPNCVSYTTILSAYCARGDVDIARKLLDEFLDRGCMPDATTYTVLVHGYCRLNRLVEAVRMMDEMEESKVAPNEITYSVVIESCCSEKRSGEAQNLLNDMLEAGYMPSPALCCRVIDALCEDGKAEDACKVWRNMLDANCMPDNSILSTLIHWLCKEGKVERAVALFGEFKKGFIPSLLAYNTLISGLCENGELQEAARVWDDMLEKRCSPNDFTYNVLVKGFCHVGKVEEAVKVLEEMLKKGFAPNKLTYKVLIDGVRKSGANEGDTIQFVVDLPMRGGILDGGCWDIFVREVISEKGNNGEIIDSVLEI